MQRFFFNSQFLSISIILDPKQVLVGLLKWGELQPIDLNGYWDYDVNGDIFFFFLVPWKGKNKTPMETVFSGSIVRQYESVKMKLNWLRSCQIFEDPEQTPKSGALTLSIGKCDDEFRIMDNPFAGAHENQGIQNLVFDIMYARTTSEN